MRELAILSIHLIATLAKCLRPRGVRAVVAESLLLKQQPSFSTVRASALRIYGRWIE